MRAMIKNVKLFIKFWVKATKTDVYLRNRTVTKFLINEAFTTSKKTFIEIKFLINYVRVWEYKCYSHVNLKLLLVKERRDKFMNRDRLNVFMRYVKNIDKQYRLWVLNLYRVIKNHAIKFAENEKSEDINLRLRKQTFNVLSERRFVRRLLKNNVLINVSESDSFMINVSFELINALKIIAINLNTLFKITLETLNEREIYTNV